jgi:Fe-S cluster assembly protein SufD
MSTGTPEQTPLSRLIQDGRPSPNEPHWLSEIRARAGEQVLAMPLPDRRHEAWRYTTLDFLRDTRFQAANDDFSALLPSDIEEFLLESEVRARFVFVNGRLAPALCHGLFQTEGVELRHLGDSLGEPSEALRGRMGRIADKQHVFAALNGALMSDGALIRIAAATQAPGPIEILHVTVGMEEPLISHPRHLVVVEEGASVDLVERYCALGDGDYFTNALIEVELGEHSHLRHMRSQEESAVARHLSDLQVRLAASARYKLATVALGAAWSRTDVGIRFAGEQASAALDGLLLARDRQLSDVHLDIFHDVPACTSRETFRGILDGKGRVVFDGHIRVAKDAQKTDAVLSNDNLMLSRAAEVDTKPQLEIYADDVKCSHGTTVGELDADMLFYLRSRGIPERQAIQMLCQGFAGEILARVSDAGLRRRREKALATRLVTLNEQP